MESELTSNPAALSVLITKYQVDLNTLGMVRERERAAPVEGRLMAPKGTKPLC